jgi:hypothetical protein
LALLTSSVHFNSVGGNGVNLNLFWCFRYVLWQKSGWCDLVGWLWKSAR